MITFILWAFGCALLKVPIDGSNMSLMIMLAIMSDLNWLAHIGK